MQKWEWMWAYFALCEEGGWFWVCLDSKVFKICEQFSFSLDVSCLQVRIAFLTSYAPKNKISFSFLMQNRNLQCAMHKWHQRSAVLVGNVGFLAEENKSCYKAGWFRFIRSSLMSRSARLSSLWGMAHRPAQVFTIRSWQLPLWSGQCQ